MNSSPSPKEPNTLGNASLVLGIGLCALTGVAQNWIRLVGTLLFICGGSSAFLGFLGGILGLAGLFGKTALAPPPSSVSCLALAR